MGAVGPLICLWCGKDHYIDDMGWLNFCSDECYRKYRSKWGHVVRFFREVWRRIRVATWYRFWNWWYARDCPECGQRMEHIGDDGTYYICLDCGLDVTVRKGIIL